MLTTCEFLAFENTERIRNNQNYLEIPVEESQFILSYDSIVFLSHLYFDIEALSKLNLICSNTVKSQLESDINEELNDLSSDSSFGTMLYLNGKIQSIEYTSEFRRNRTSQLNRLKNILNRIKCIDDSYDYVPKDETWREPFSKIKLKKCMLCECSSLGSAQNIPNSILVTDDQNVYSIAATEGISCVGLAALFTYAISEWERLLEISQALCNINFLNYLPIFLYKKMVDCLLEDEEHISEGIEMIIDWLTSDTDGEPTQAHENVIIELNRQVCTHKDWDYLDLDRVLGNLAIKAFEKQNPGYIARQMKLLFDGLKTYPKDNPTTEKNDTNDSQ